MNEKPQPPDPTCPDCGGSGWVQPSPLVKVTACHCNPDHLDPSPIDAADEPPC